MDNNDSIYIDLILQLYKQMEKATDKIDDEITGLRNITSEMIDVLKASVTNEQIVEDIRETNRKVEPTLTKVSNIYTKCEAHGKDVKSINTYLSKLSNWVKTMIAVVLITFSLLTISYFFTRSSIETMVKSEFNSAESLRNTQSDVTSEDYRSLKKQLEDIQMELKKHEGQH